MNSLVAEYVDYLNNLVWLALAAGDVRLARHRHAFLCRVEAEVAANREKFAETPS